MLPASASKYCTRPRHESSICGHFPPKFFPPGTLLNALVSRCHYLSILTMCSSTPHPGFTHMCKCFGGRGLWVCLSGQRSVHNGLSHQLKRLYPPAQAGSAHRLPLVKNHSEQLLLRSTRQTALLEEPRTREGSIFRPEAGKEARGVKSYRNTEASEMGHSEMECPTGGLANCICSVELLKPTRPGF